MRTYRKVLILLLAIFILQACKTNQITTSTEKPTIAKLGNVPLLVEDFQYIYEKSSENPDYSEESLRSYLDLYINFKLKIVDAEAKKLDEKESFLKELNSYKEQLAKPYLIDQDKVDEMVQEAYERMQEEVNVSHILIEISEDAEPTDTLQAYEEILNIRDKVLQGESFENLAVRYSDDDATQKNGGNLNYFTALTMVYGFENYAYGTEIGDVSDPFRTQFGYHFLKVNDRRQNSGKIQTAHIMVSIPKNHTKEDSLKAQKKINEIYTLIEQGEDWDKLCRQYSDDAISRDEGGVLPEFGIGTVIPEYEKAAFGLEFIGDISEPIFTPFGWHIIKLIKQQNLESFEELEPLIRQKVMRDSRYKVTQDGFITKLQLLNSLKVNESNLELALSKADDDLLKGRWRFATTDSDLSKELFSFESKEYEVSKTYTIAEFFEYAEERQIPKPDLSQPSHYMQILYDKFLDNSTIAFERELLELKYPEYHLLVQEYKEGMLLFQIMNEQVWNKALQDSLVVRNFYEANKDKYTWQDRARVSIFDMRDEQFLDRIKNRLKEELFLMQTPKLPTINFDKNDTSLDKAKKNSLETIPLFMDNNPNLIIEVSTHAGKDEDVQASDLRAKAVVAELKNLGVTEERIITKDFGNSKPLSIENDEQNRRVKLRFYSTSPEVLENEFNEENPLNLSVRQATISKENFEYSQDIPWQKGEYTLQKEDRTLYIIIHETLPTRSKTFEEAKGVVIADYQIYLEQEWLNALKSQYPVEVNEVELAKLVK